MGGDLGPDVVIDGALQALGADPLLNIILVGPPEVVEPAAARHERMAAHAATEVIAMAEHPATAVRKKRDSSIVVGCRLVKEGAAAGFFSAGSTGACLAAGTLVVGRIKGVKRPALGQIVPTPKKPILLMDVGANADCKPEYLVQFAAMGVAYMQGLMQVKNPSVGLLNIGEEETKGSLFAQETYELMRAEVPQFAGNCEGGNLMAGDFDVVVTDGFTGNVCLKTIEGTAKTMMIFLKEALMGSTLSKLGALLVKGNLSGLKAKLSPDTYGGAPLLGVKGVVIVGHGSSNATAIKNGIAVAAQTARAGVPELIASHIKAQGEVARGEVREGEVVLGIAASGEAAQGEVALGEVSPGKAVQDEVSQGEAVRQHALKEEAHASDAQ
jgi:glycerol-3-phosphate acyltransferase PlsX